MPPATDFCTATAAVKSALRAAKAAQPKCLAYARAASRPVTKTVLTDIMKTFHVRLVYPRQKTNAAPKPVTNVPRQTPIQAVTAAGKTVRKVTAMMKILTNMSVIRGPAKI